MMLIIPAVDIRAGSCVRLVRGDPGQSTTYSSDPIEMARMWVERGARRIHVIDLDGAFSGQPHHLEMAAQMKNELKCEIQFGGGLREKDSVKRALDLGIDKLILGTAALENKEWVKSALEWHAERLMVAIDALENHVAKEGWKEDTAFTTSEALKQMESLGFKEVIFTDINRDGTLEGPNFDSIREVVAQTRMGVYASGGISNLQDVTTLKAIAGLRGVVIGKALYAEKMSLHECLRD